VARKDRPGGICRIFDGGDAQRFCGKTCDLQEQNVRQSSQEQKGKKLVLRHSDIELLADSILFIVLIEHIQ
jgi:hypothetical protein